MVKRPITKEKKRNLANPKRSPSHHPDQSGRACNSVTNVLKSNDICSGKPLCMFPKDILTARSRALLVEPMDYESSIVRKSLAVESP